MDIPVSGFMYHSDDSDPIHSHQLYITSWDGRPIHNHQFKGVTSFDDGHSHRYAGTTEPAPSGVPHTHRYFTSTSVDDRHRHQIRGITGSQFRFQMVVIIMNLVVLLLLKVLDHIDTDILEEQVHELN